MKQAKEYLFSSNLPELVYLHGIDNEIIRIIKEAQKDAIRHTVKVCADEAELNYGEDEGQSTEIDKQSILSVADKLIKDINETH